MRRGARAGSVSLQLRPSIPCRPQIGCRGCRAQEARTRADTGRADRALHGSGQEQARASPIHRPRGASCRRHAQKIAAPAIHLRTRRFFLTLAIRGCQPRLSGRGAQDSHRTANPAKRPCAAPEPRRRAGIRLNGPSSHRPGCSDFNRVIVARPSARAALKVTLASGHPSLSRGALRILSRPYVAGIGPAHGSPLMVNCRRISLNPASGLIERRHGWSESDVQRLGETARRAAQRILLRVGSRGAIDDRQTLPVARRAGYRPLGIAAPGGDARQDGALLGGIERHGA